jgi:predicted amidohydrolase YtcJ
MSQPVNLYLENGVFYTLNASIPRVSAMAISEGKILAMGNPDELQDYKKAAAAIINLKGQTVLPGFTDTHAHLMDTAQNLATLDLSHAKSLEDCISKLKKTATHHKKDNDWVIAHGFDDTRIREKTSLTYKELDSASLEKPIAVFRIDLHSCILNSAGLTKLALDKNTDGIEKESKGEPTGILRGKANSMAYDLIIQSIGDGQKKEGLEKACQYAIEHGITSIHCLEGGSEINEHNLELLKSCQDTLPLRTVIYHQTTDVQKVLREGYKSIGGCILLDGSIGSRTAAVSQPYFDDPASRDNTGILYFTDAQLNEFVEEAHQAGLQIAMHAIGDRAIGQLLDAYERVLDKYPRADHRHRIEHFELCTPGQIQKAARLKVILAMQPAFDYYWGGHDHMYHSRLGLGRSLNSNPFRKILDAGCLIAGGSDSDVTPLDPMLGIYSALNHSNPRERMTIEEAVRIYTANAAFAAFEEKERGTLEVGKQADLTVLAQDLFKARPDDLKDIPVTMTISRGKVVFQKAEDSK